MYCPTLEVNSWDALLRNACLVEMHQQGKVSKAVPQQTDSELEVKSFLSEHQAILAR